MKVLHAQQWLVWHARKGTEANLDKRLDSYNARVENDLREMIAELGVWAATWPDAYGRLRPLSDYISYFDETIGQAGGPAYPNSIDPLENRRTRKCLEGNQLASEETDRISLCRLLIQARTCGWDHRYLKLCSPSVDPSRRGHAPGPDEPQGTTG